MKIPLKIKKNSFKSKVVAVPNQDVPKVITVWSPQASGKSVVASTLATTLAGTMPEKKICLVDFDLYAPAFTSEVDLNKITESIFRGDFDGQRSVKAIPAVKGYKNFYCLGGLTDVVSMDLLKKENVEELLEALKEHFDHLVIDAGREINLATTIAAFYAANLLVIPVLGIVENLRHVRRYLNILEEGLKLDRANIKIVLNEYQGTLSLTETKELLERPVEAAIPYSKKLTEIFNKNIDRQISEQLLSLAMPRGSERVESSKTNKGLKYKLETS